MRSEAILYGHIKKKHAQACVSKFLEWPRVLLDACSVIEINSCIDVWFYGVACELHAVTYDSFRLWGRALARVGACAY